MKLVLFTTIFCMGMPILSKAQGPVCTGQTLGEPTPSTASTTPGPNTGFTYVLLGASTAIPCCGVVSQWKYVTAATGDLTPQVWSQTAGNVYQVVGENVISGVSAGQVSTFGVATTAQISVEQGYRIGWHSSGADIVPYEATGSAVMGRVGVSGKTSIGSSATLPTSLIDGEQWQIAAVLDPNTPPTFGTSLPASVTALTSDAVGTVVHTVTPTDVNPDDISSLTVSIAPTNAYFDLVGNDVQIKTSLSVGSYIVVLNVVDHCLTTGTATLTVVVTDSAPIITSLPVSAVLLKEDVSIATSLHALTFTDDGPLTDVTCRMVTITPSPAPFVVKMEPGTSTYTVYYQPDVTTPLSYDVTPLYSMDIVCNDGISDSVAKEFQVSIQPNEPPVPNIPAAGISVSAATTTNGLLVYTVTSTDPENDDVTYNMTSDCPLRMFPNGEIVATQDLNAYRISPCTAYVTVTDGYNVVGPTELVVTITDINTPPTISDPTQILPKIDTVHVKEHTDEGTPNLVGSIVKVFTAIGADVDGDTLTWEMTFDNGQGEDLFTFDPATGIISTKTDLDYETLSRDGLLTTRVSVRVFDGREYSEQRVINVVVDDVNETPKFNQVKYAIETTEGTATTTLPCAFFDVTDEDLYDTRQYDINCGAVGLFHIPSDRSSSCDAYIVQTEEYDLDTPGAASKVVTCIITVIDKGGLTATTTLEITVHEEDDNPPVLDKTSYAYTITNATDPGGSFGNADATDKDFLALHRRHTFSTDSSEFGVDANGVFFSKVDWSNYPVPTTRTFNLRVTDEAGHTDTAPVTVNINPVYPTTTTTTTTAAPSSDDITSFFDDEGNLAWFIPTMILSAVALGLLGYLLYSGIVGGGCRNFGNIFRGGGRRIGRFRGGRPPPPRQRVIEVTRVPKRAIEATPQEVVRPEPSPAEKRSGFFDCLRKRPPKPKAPVKATDEAKTWHLWGQNDFKSMNKWVG